MRAWRVALVIAVAVIALFLWRHRSRSTAHDQGGEPTAARPAPATAPARPLIGMPSAAAAEVAGREENERELEEGGERDELPATPPPMAPPELPGPSCPAALPSHGSPCGLSQAASLRCGYDDRGGEIVCDCVATAAGTEPTWSCAKDQPETAPPPCPTTQPVTDARCLAEGQLCRYGEGADSIMCPCKSGKWACTTSWEWRPKE
jgi:hypothetical protein